MKNIDDYISDRDKVSAEISELLSAFIEKYDLDNLSVDVICSKFITFSGVFNNYVEVKLTTEI